jgi:hypothetical protein
MIDRNLHSEIRDLIAQENPKKASVGYIVFAGDRARQIDQNIIALPWFELYKIFSD